jgi:hypothetical protein
MEEWSQHEKAKADAVAESYRNCLAQEQAVIDSQATELLAVQMERGMTLLGQNDNEDNKADPQDNIASRKKALQEQTTNLEIEIMKLQTERDNRERRVHGKALKNTDEKSRLKFEPTVSSSIQ